MEALWCLPIQCKVWAVSIGLMIIMFCSCTDQNTEELDQALALFYENKMEQALPHFEQLADRDRDDADIYAWLAETHRRLGRKGAAVKMAAKAIALEPCHSFAHTVIADACHPFPVGTELLDSDTTWVHITKAVECDSTDGNAWIYLCGEAMIRRKYDVMRKAAGKLVETDFLTDAALAFGRWLLQTLPENAILITNGDMDTFPVMALQKTEGLRTDVAVAEKNWLGLKQYLSYLRDHYHIPLPVMDAHVDSLHAFMGFPENMLFVSALVFNGWLRMKAENSFSRPIALAITVYEDYYEDVKDQFQYAGPYLLWQSTSVYVTPDTSAIRKSIAGIRTDDFTGPWVSEADRSPVRKLYTKHIVKNVTQAAIVYSEEMINAKNFREALRILSWAEDFEKKTELGPVHAEQLSQLKAEAEGRQ